MGEYSDGCDMDDVIVQTRVVGFQRSQVSVL